MPPQQLLLQQMPPQQVLEPPQLLLGLVPSAAVLQVPLPLQILQVPQSVPDGHRAQAPLPSQSPVNPQVMAACPVQSLFGSPEVTSLHDPVPLQILHRAHQVPEV